MKVNYDNNYKLNDQNIPLKVEFHIDINRNFTPRKDTVKVTNFSFNINDGQKEDIIPLIKDNEESVNILASILGKDKGDASVVRKVDLWGTRESVQKCFILKDGTGYFNTGRKHPPP